MEYVDGPVVYYPCAGADAVGVPSWALVMTADGSHRGIAYPEVSLIDICNGGLG